MKPRKIDLLSRHHRRALWMRPLWIVVGGLSVVLGLLYFEIPRDLCWYAIGLTVVSAAVARVWPRRTLRKPASTLDAKLDLKNRLEAVVELGERADPLAEAARAEVNIFL